MNMNGVVKNVMTPVPKGKGISKRTKFMIGGGVVLIFVIVIVASFFIGGREEDEEEEEEVEEEIEDEYQDEEEVTEETNTTEEEVQENNVGNGENIKDSAVNATATTAVPVAPPAPVPSATTALPADPLQDYPVVNSHEFYWESQIGQGTKSDLQTCARTCTDTPDCKGFHHHPTSTDCLLFSDNSYRKQKGRKKKHTHFDGDFGYRRTPG